MDAGNHTANRPALDALLKAITEEFPELGIEQMPIGIVSRCHLGSPYEVHICDFAGGILEHFETFRPMPALFEAARSLARHPSYSFVEIYRSTMHAISADGSVSVIDKKQEIFE